MKKLICIPFFVFGLLFVQGQEINKEDYTRAVSFMYENYNNKTAFNLFTSVNWFEDGSGLWFVDYSKDNKSYKTVDFKKGRVTELFNHANLATALSKLSDEKFEANKLSLSNIEKRKGKLKFSMKNKSYMLDLKTYALELLEEKKKEEANPFETTSPDGKWIAYTKDYNLFIKSTETNKEFQLSTNGEKGYEYASWYGWYDKMEGENGERPKRFYVDWSEDSKWLGASVVDTRNAEKMYLLDWSIDSLYKPKLLSYYRGSPGEKTMVQIKPVFYNIETKQEVKTSLQQELILIQFQLGGVKILVN